MKTDVIVVSSNGDQMEKALNQAELVEAYKNLSVKNTLQLRLLIEEMMGMMRSITGETEGRFWIEDDDGVYQLHLLVETGMTFSKRDKLLSASTSGRNEAAHGLMGWLRDFFDRGADRDVNTLMGPMILPEMSTYSAGDNALSMEWSLSRYSELLAPLVERKEADAMQAWDELEKSVVAHVADDVKVSIKGNNVEMILVKKFA